MTDTIAEPTAVAAEAAPNYAVYLKAWVVLLCITLLMVAYTHTGVLIAGMVAKATIIALWFMHLRYEKRDFVLYILLPIVGVALLLFGLIAPDGLAM